MEADLLVDGATEGAVICSGLSERLINSWFSNCCGRFFLILAKILGVAFDFFAFYIFFFGGPSISCPEECQDLDTIEIDSCESDCESLRSTEKTIGDFFVTLFVMDRILLIPLLLLYGYHPDKNKLYQRYLDRFMEENKKITSRYGVTSLWYGALFNFPDYIAKLWIIDENAICGKMGWIYILFINIEGIILFAYIGICASAYFGNIPIGDVEISYAYELLILAVTSATIGFGTVQHFVNIAYNLRGKSLRKHEKQQQAYSAKHIIAQQQHATQPRPVVEQQMIKLPNGEIQMVQVLQQPQQIPSDVHVATDNTAPPEPHCCDPCLKCCGHCGFLCCMATAGFYFLTFCSMCFVATLFVPIVVISYFT